MAKLGCKNEWRRTKPEPKGRATKTEEVSLIDDDFDDVGSLPRIVACSNEDDNTFEMFACLTKFMGARSITDQKLPHAKITNTP